MKLSKVNKSTPVTFFKPRKIMGYEIFNNILTIRSPEQREARRKAKRERYRAKLRRGTYRHGRVGVKP